MKRYKKFKIHSKKAKPKYYDFYVKKKRTKNGKAQFCKKKRIFRFRIISWDLVGSPGISEAKMKIIEAQVKDLQLRFPYHEIVGVQIQTDPDTIHLICKGKDIDEDNVVAELMPSPYSVYRREFGDGLSGDN
jgi:hypothetical protein